jgi:hypothetical protein
MRQAFLVFQLSEHLTDVNTVSLCELASGLSGSLLVENPLHRVEHIAAIFRGSKISQCSILVYCGDNLRNLGFHGLFGVLDLFDPLVALVSQIGQIVLEAHHAVVGGTIRALLDTVFFSNLPRLILALPESVTEIVSRIALLFGEGAGLGIAQHIRKMHVPSFDLTTIDLAVGQRHQILVIRPLIAYKQK